MKQVSQIVYRHITAADFFNINKPKGATAGGGGQSYIDFPTSAIRSEDWRRFFSPRRGRRTRSGPLYEIELHSVGLEESQTVEIGQRRPSTYNIRNQRITSNEANRVYSWDPRLTNFPKPRDPLRPMRIQHLVVYLAKAGKGQFWAGWFHASHPKSSWKCDHRLQPMFDEHEDGAAGSILLDPPILIDETDLRWPFRGAARGTRAYPRHKTVRTKKVKSTTLVPKTSKQELTFRTTPESKLLNELFVEDKSGLAEKNARRHQVTRSVIRRNARIVPQLKKLYKGKCQISGAKYVFIKNNGDFHTEAHHLMALGRGGADAPKNIIIVSPLIHRMLHHAEVSEINLQKIQNNELAIHINGKRYSIKWHPRHTSVVLGRA